jgi:hypothetical protein
MLISIFIDFALVRYFDLSKATPRTIGLRLTTVSFFVTKNYWIDINYCVLSHHQQPIDCFLKAIINTSKMMMSHHPIFGDDELSPHPLSLVLL